VALSIPPAEVERLLTPISTALEADGYRLSATASGEALRIDVAATPEACAECLVPKSMMETMVRKALSAQPGAESVPIEIGYPTD
jgi:hypothetical protein